MDSSLEATKIGRTYEEGPVAHPPPLPYPHPPTSEWACGVGEGMRWFAPYEGSPRVPLAGVPPSKLHTLLPTPRDRHEPAPAVGEVGHPGEGGGEEGKRRRRGRRSKGEVVYSCSSVTSLPPQSSWSGWKATVLPVRPGNPRHTAFGSTCTSLRKLL